MPLSCLAMSPIADSLQALLRKTTTESLYIHPGLWSTSHLTALHVSGFDRTYPLQHIINKQLAQDPPDVDLARIFNAIAKWPQCDEPKLAQHLYAARRNSTWGTSDRYNSIYAYVCERWLESIFSDFRGLRDMEK